MGNNQSLELLFTAVSWQQSPKAIKTEIIHPLRYLIFWLESYMMKDDKTI